MITDAVSACNLSIKRMIIGLIAILTFGCSVSVPQVEYSYKFVKGLTGAGEFSSQEQAAIWLASVGDRGAVLRPYLSGGLTVFANTDGDAIAFDGWTIRSVMGFELAGPLSISGKDGKRIFSTAGQITSTECEPWYLSGRTWRQACTNGDGEIVLSEEGNIELILMSLGENFGIVTLKLAK